MQSRIKNYFGAMALGVSAVLMITAAVIAVPVERGTGMGETAVQETAAEHGNMTLKSEDGKDVSLLVSEIALADFEAYGVSPIAETAYTLTATVNEDATEKAVDWSVAWENASSEWATGKTVTDYVTLSNTGDLTATASCLQPFGEAVIVSAASRDDPAVKATCTCDYLSRVVGGGFHVYSSIGVVENTTFASGYITSEGMKSTELKFSFDRDYYFDAWNGSGVGTLAPNYSNPQSKGVGVSLAINESAKEKLQEYGYIVGSCSKYAVHLQGYFAPSIPATTLDISALTTIFGSNASSKTFYDAVVAAQNSGFHDFLDLCITSAYTDEVFICTFDIDAESFYTPVLNVQVDQTDLKF